MILLLETMVLMTLNVHLKCWSVILISTSALLDVDNGSGKGCSCLGYACAIELKSIALECQLNLTCGRGTLWYAYVAHNTTKHCLSR